MWQVSYSYNGVTNVLNGSYSPAGTCAGDTYQCNLVPVPNTLWSISWQSRNFFPVRRAACVTGPCRANANDSQPTPNYYFLDVALEYVSCS